MYIRVDSATHLLSFGLLVYQCRTDTVSSSQHYIAVMVAHNAASEALRCTGDN